MATSKSNETASRDFYSGMEDWQREQLMGDAAFESEFRDAMSNVANKAASKPRQIAGLTGREQGSMKVQNEATRALAQGLGGINRSLNGVSVDDSLGRIQGPAAMGQAQSAAQWRDVEAPTSDFNTVNAPDFADIGAIRSGYENQYTDDVVNTTLAGMTREQQRAQLERDARAASVGGLSNSRAAVADAVAGNLSQMSMAEMEAKLRSDAFNTAANYGLQETDMRNQFGMDSTQFTADQEAMRRQYGLDLADFGLSQEQARSSHDRALAEQDLARQRAYAENALARAGFDLDEAIAQAAQGNAAAQLELQKAGISQDLYESVYGARTNRADRMQGLGEAQREINQERNDARYYGGMEAGSWLADVYSGSRTRDSAPYNYTETASATKDDGAKEPSKWQQFAAGAAAGLSSFL